MPATTLSTSTSTPITTAVTATIGVILFAHGSRDTLWRTPIEAVQTHIQALHPQLPVSCAYLELCSPDLAQAAAALIAQGASHIRIVPLFLGTGRHAREDLPKLVAALEQEQPHVIFTIETPVGEDPRVTALLAQIATE